MKKIITILLIASLPLIGYAAWLTETTKSNGTTAVEIQSAPAASTSRTVPANGGITINNTATTQVVFTVQYVDDTVTNVLEVVALNADYQWQNDWVVILDNTNAVVQVVGATAFGDALDITTHYRDEGQ